VIPIEKKIRFSPAKTEKAVDKSTAEIWARLNESP